MVNFFEGFALKRLNLQTETPSGRKAKQIETNLKVKYF